MSKKSFKCANGEGTITRRNDGRWQGTYTTGVNLGTGKQMRKSVYASTKEECAGKLRNAMAAMQEGDIRDPDKTALSAWMDYWIEECQGENKFNTVRGYRTLPLTPAMLALLKRQWVNQAEQKLLAGDAWQGWKNERERKTAFCFTTELGNHLQPQTAYNHYKKLADRIGSEDTNVHTLQHTYATCCLANGDDIKTVSENLGHSTPAFTLSIYAHSTDAMKRLSAQRMQSYIETVCGL